MIVIVYELNLLSVNAHVIYCLLNRVFSVKTRVLYCLGDGFVIINRSLLDKLLVNSMDFSQSKHMFFVVFEFDLLSVNTHDRCL